MKLIIALIKMIINKACKLKQSFIIFFFQIIDYEQIHVVNQLKAHKN